MNERLREIRQRRAALIALSDIQRATLVLQVQRWERPIAFFDAGYAVARAIGARPVVALIGVAVLARSRWPRLGRLLEYASVAWQVFRTAREFLPAPRSTERPRTEGRTDSAQSASAQPQ